MAEFSAMPLWTDAYLGDTTHLSTLEHGAYFLLLVTAWRSKDGTLPDDDKALAKYARLTLGQWKRIKPTIERFFKVENGVWMQSRLTDELKAVRQKSKRQTHNIKARWLKNKETTDTTVIPNDTSGNTSHTHTHNPYPESPPTPPSGGGSLKVWDSDFIASYKIEHKLSELGLKFARNNAPGWDVYVLMAEYDKKIREGTRDPPDKPDVAFPAWCAAYTKGKPP